MRPDVVVVGSGNAAISAAISARREGARVLVLERAPVEFRGGNTRHTRDIRHAHATSLPSAPGVYAEDEFLADLESVSDGTQDRSFARLVVEESAALPAWMERHGVRWQPQLRGALHLSRTNSFFLGGGKALLNAYHEAAAALGVEVAYDTCVEGVEPLDGKVRIRVRGAPDATLEAPAVVVAAGGFEANLDWLRRYWGDAVDNYIVRGSPYNDGTILANLLSLGAASVGDPKGFHAVAVDARSPKYDGGIVTRVDATPYGVAVNADGRRFYDEGEDLWPKRYASWGRLIAEQPGQAAYALFDSAVRGLFIPSVFPAVVADTLPDLARALRLDPARVSGTVDEFNGHLDHGGRFDPGVLDGVSTQGLHPAKSNWAVPISRPPFGAYPLRPGITFTYMGVKVDLTCRVLKPDGSALPGIFAAGELMAGNVLTKGYLAGLGLTIGTVSGIRAGREAARHAR